jgi:cytochrome c oxidase subunit 2
MSSSITPPEKRIWWREPLDRVEATWVIIALVWSIIMFVMMPYWHVYGEQNLSNESYRIDPEAYAKKAQAMVDQYTVRKEVNGTVPVVHPPAGSDVYLIARKWDWWPILELEKDKSYRLHLSSMDWQHGFSLQPTNINIQVHPGYDLVTTVTPNRAGQFGVVCNEYCGILHHNMVSRLYVVE